jgi:hypothetical protein
MTDFRHLREADIERLLAGETPPEAAEAAGVAAFARDLRAGCPEEAVPNAVQTAQIAACVAAAGELAAGVPSPLVRRRRPLRLALKVAVVSTVLVLLFCGLALAGALPPSIEAPVSRAALRLGIHLPDAAPTPPARAHDDPTAGPTHIADPSATAKAQKSADPTPKSESQHTPKPSHSPEKDHSGAQPASGSSGGSGDDGQDGDSATTEDHDQDKDPPSADQSDDEDPPQADEDAPHTDEDSPPDAEYTPEEPQKDVQVEDGATAD